jgi:hypothetical protein
MAAIVTDQFRISNASNFIDSVGDTSANSFYIFLSLPNPTSVGFGREGDWDTNTPNPIDSFNNLNHVKNTIICGKRITSDNCRRLIRRIDWERGTRYEMYRHDYDIINPSPVTKSTRLYDSNYYVMSSNYGVYICIDNGSSGINTTGNASQDEPLFTDLEPSKAGESGDGYLWKYLFTVSPSDIIKFDSTEYISVPNNWDTTNHAQISVVRDNGDSSVNNNQIKKVYIENQGFGYSDPTDQELNIIGDGTGGKVVLQVEGSKIIDVSVSSGGKGYTYGVVDLGPINQNATSNFAKLIPIIPPSRGHGYDAYTELGTDKILMYARFDDSTKDFPIDTKFCQIGILKNPTSIGSTNTFNDIQFTNLYGIKFSSTSGSLVVGDTIRQSLGDGAFAYGYVASYDSETKVVKYFRDRSLYFNQSTYDQTDYVGVSTFSRVLNFSSTVNPVTSNFGFSGTIDTSFTGITTNPSGSKIINLGTQFTNGLSQPEINIGSGDIIYLDNRPTITRNSRQKEDIKIILEF